MAINKKELSDNDSNQIQSMFNALAPRYDFLNRVLSVGYDKYWRKVGVNQFGNISNKTILDVATGTADIVLERFYEVGEDPYKWIQRELETSEHTGCFLSITFLICV